MKKIGLVRAALLFLAVVIIFLMFWFLLPPLNPVSPEFWFFALISAAALWAAWWIPGNIGDILNSSGKAKLVRVKVVSGKYVNIAGNQKKMPKAVAITAVCLVLLVAVLLATGLPMFNASRYRDLLIRREGNFTDDIAEISMNQIPVVDHDTAIQLGKRKLGEIAELVSQFEISEDYTQINLNGRPVRVTPLVYADFFKWLNNHKKGIAGYIKVDMVSQETALVKLENGIKYSPSDLFLRNLSRHLRFSYPTKMFDNYAFEVDENGTPYWIAPTYNYTIGVWGGRDINGAVLVNAIDGSHKWYPLEDIPQWVDRVFSADLVLRHLNYNGRFQDGYLNSIIGQKGVLQTTAGYNYLAINDDVYLYTGMTSVTGDESNVGFVLVNLRTKQTRFYSVPGAEEMSAMSSAEGQVQHLGYIATFPILLNVADRPTYFLSLKDDAGLVKMYAFVDVERYQIVGTGQSVADARNNYVKALSKEQGVGAGTGTEISGEVADIATAVMDGNTYYYIRLKENDAVFVASIHISNRLPFIKVGDAITFIYSGSGEIREVLSMK